MIKAIQAIDLVYDDILLRVDGDEVFIELNCSDTFWWGTADSEPIEAADIPTLQASYNDVKAAHGDTAFSSLVALLFVARKRRMRPQGAIYKGLPEYMHRLLNGCGPYREVGPGNPRDVPNGASL